MRHTLLPTLLLALAAAAAPAWAGDIDGFHPPRGAPGDVVYVQGAQFTTRPVVTFGDVRAVVIRAGADALLCRVPEGLAEDAVELRVDGAPAPQLFRALSPSRPVVHDLSTAVGTHRQAVFAYGRRLHRACVAFVDPRGNTATRIDVVGGRRAVVFLVPETLEPGTYVLVFTNGDGLSTDAASPQLEVVGRQTPELNAIHSEGAVPSRAAVPGQRVRCVGTDLGPSGPCRVHWTDRRGVRTESRGHANGYDLVLTSVPAVLAGGEPYGVEVELASGALSRPLTWTPAQRADPAVVTVTPPTGPAACYVSLQGAGLSASVADVSAELSSAHGTTDIDVVYRHPGGLGHGAAWILRLPAGLAEGDYDLVFRIGDRAAPATTFRVAEQDLAVTGLWPRRAPRGGPCLPTLIEGSGFGPTRASDDLRVLWTNGVHAQEGTVVYRSDRAMRILPPPACCKGLGPEEEWSVFVLRGRGTKTGVIKAGAVSFVGEAR